MKCRAANKTATIKRKKPRPFLVLPSLDNISFKICSKNKCNKDTESEMPKKPPGLKLFTKTWPPKRDFKDDEDRPLTATLEKPTILNTNLIGKIDMSKVRKEFLNISNLCRFPLGISKTRRKKPPLTRPLSLLPPPKTRKTKRPDTSSPDSWEDEESYSSHSVPARTVAKKKVSDANNNNNNNNTKLLKIPRKRMIGNEKNLGVDNFVVKSTKLPEPCKTCGRPDQPERFHSHPATPLRLPKAKMDEETKIPVKSSVQKPVAIKYKSKQVAEKKTLPTQRKPSLPAQKLVHTPPAKSENTEKTPRVPSAKRLLTCYICGREFGTASLPLHEPKCLQKWERENAGLPLHLQRKAPVKPDHPMTKEEWNQFAWDTAQVRYQKY